MGDTMSLEATLKSLLGPVVSGRCYPDTVPDNPVFPLIVYQGVGGVAVEYVEQVIADKENSRVQVWVWSKSRPEASTVARQARAAIIGSALQANTLAAPVSTYDEAMKLYGARADFSIWYTPT